MKILAVPYLAATLLFTAAAPAMAQDIKLLPEGQTLVSLSVTERVKVQQDTLHASLRIEDTDKDPKALQDRINKAMEKAVKTAKGVSAVKTSTGYYSVYQEHVSSGGREAVKWRGAQTIDLESKDSQKVLDLAGQIQGMGFVMNNLSYTLSTAKADEIRDGLMESALTRAKDKANRAAKALGKAQVDIAMVNVDAAMDFPQPVMMMKSYRGAAEAADMASPTAEAGESEVTLTVTVHAVAK